MYDKTNPGLTQRARMSASHIARWALNRERYLEAHAKSAATRKGRRKLKVSRSLIFNQYGVGYESIADACAQLNLKERLIRLVLEGKRKSTGGFQFVVAGRRGTEYRTRWLTQGISLQGP